MANGIPSFSAEKLLEKKMLIGKVVFWGGLAAGAAWLWVQILPFLKTLIWGTLEVAAGASLLGAIFLILGNKKLRTALTDVFSRNIPLAITRLLVKMGPTAFLDAYRDKVVDYSQEVDQNTANVLGMQNFLRTIIKRVNKSKQSAYELAEGSAELQQDEMVGLYMQNYKDFEEDLAEYQELDEALTLALGHLKKLRTYVGGLLRYIEGQNERLKIKFEVSKNVRSAFASAMRFLTHGEDRELYDMATTDILQSVGRNMAFVQNIIERSDGLFREMDLKEAIAKRQGKRYLQEVKARVNELNQSARTLNQSEPLDAAASLNRTTPAATSDLSTLIRNRQG